MRIEYTLISYRGTADTCKRDGYDQNDERNGANNRPCNSESSLNIVVFSFGNGDDAENYAGDAQPPKREQRNTGKYKRQDCNYHNLVPSFLNCGAPCATRTHDLLVTNQLRYQLRQRGMVGATGVEPAWASSQNWWVTVALHPGIKTIQK